MVLERWNRELGGLAAFLLILYGAVTWTHRTTEGSGSDDVNASQMTKARIYSDSALYRSDFENASLHLNDLLVADPHNSHARYRLAWCHYDQYMKLYARLRFSRRDSITDPARLNSMKVKLKEHGDEAIKLFQRCTRSHRYRGKSLFQLAILSALRRDREQTLDSLQRFLSLNYWTKLGIAQRREFGFLLDDSEFQRLVVEEQRIKKRGAGRGTAEIYINSPRL